jgi:hypothetical protein
MAVYALNERYIKDSKLKAIVFDCPGIEKILNKNLTNKEYGI